MLCNGGGAESGRMGRLLLLLLPLLCLVHHVAAQQHPVFASLSGTESCEAKRLVKPTSVTEVQELVAQAAKDGDNVKVVATRHASTDINCAKGLVLDLSEMVDVQVDPEQMQATVQAGATHEILFNKLKERGFAVIHPAMKFTGLSIGGTLATGAHGSSLVHPATLSDQVVSMTMVDGMGRVRTITGEMLRATNVNIGLLGVVIDVTIRIVPQYKVHLEFTDHDEKILFDGQAIQWAKELDYIELNWFPTTRRVVMYNGTYLSNDNPGNDHAKYLFTTSTPYLAQLEDASATRKTEFFCASEIASRQALLLGTGGVPQAFNEKGEFSNKITGPMQDILVSYCSVGTCAWDRPGPKYLSIIMEFAFSLDEFPNALKAIRNIIDNRFWCPAVAEGIQIRFLRKSENYLALSAGHDVGVFEIVVPLRQKENASHYGMSTLQEIYQTMMLEFKGRPHWGKNGRSAFADPFPTAEELYPDWGAFIGVKQEMDPNGVFENEFFERMTRQKELPKFKYCAINDKCVCDGDDHCGDDQHCHISVIGGKDTGICTDGFA